MLKIITTMSQLNEEQLMAVYCEGNTENGQEMFSDYDPAEQLRFAENAFLSYLREDFFAHRDSMYMVWVVDGRYRAALRLEPYMDGLLLEALETAPEDRRKGYAYSLISSVFDYLNTRDHKRVYSHVSKRNIPSLEIHKKCGFEIISDSATYIDGTVTRNSYTLCHQL